MGGACAVHVSRSDRDERDRIRQRVGFPARHHSPPRSALDLSAADGLDRAVDLRTERRRGHVEKGPGAPRYRSAESSAHLGGMAAKVRSMLSRTFNVDRTPAWMYRSPISGVD